MAKRPETRGFLAGVAVELAVGLLLVGVGVNALRDRYVTLGLAFAAGGAVSAAMGARGLYRWRVRKKNGHTVRP
jgi:hypothetical protein